ncbi:hypothetical protein HK096_010974, partial [Nowakowskiella sp. JEL0078]
MKQIFSTSPREMIFDSFLPSQIFHFPNQNSAAPLPETAFLSSAFDSAHETPNFVQQNFTPDHARKSSNSSVSSISVTPNLRPASRRSQKSISQPSFISQNRKSFYSSVSFEQSSNICMSWNHVHQLTSNAAARYRLADSFRPEVIVAA